MKDVNGFIEEVYEETLLDLLKNTNNDEEYTNRYSGSS